MNSDFTGNDAGEPLGLILKKTLSTAGGIQDSRRSIWLLLLAQAGSRYLAMTCKEREAKPIGMAITKAGLETGKVLIPGLSN